MMSCHILDLLNESFWNVSPMDLHMVDFDILMCNHWEGMGAARTENWSSGHNLIYTSHFPGQEGPCQVPACFYVKSLRVSRLLCWNIFSWILTSCGCYIGMTQPSGYRVNRHCDLTSDPWVKRWGNSSPIISWKPREYIKYNPHSSMGLKMGYGCLICGHASPAWDVATLPAGISINLPHVAVGTLVVKLGGASGCSVKAWPLISNWHNWIIGFYMGCICDSTG